LKEQCTTSRVRRVRRLEYEAVVEAMQRRLDRMPEAMIRRRRKRLAGLLRSLRRHRLWSKLRLAGGNNPLVAIAFSNGLGRQEPPTGPRPLFAD
jgi:hypothetical protein